MCHMKIPETLIFMQKLRCFELGWAMSSVFLVSLTQIFCMMS